MNLHTILFGIILAAAGATRADPVAAETSAPSRAPFTRIGMTLGIGGGVTSFTGSEMNAAVDVGGSWEVRSTIGTRLFLAGELAYVGSRRNVSMPGVTTANADKPHVFAHGVEGALRAQLPYVTGSWLFEPFAFGGLGWTRMGIDGIVPQGSALRTSDDVLVVPFGAGLSASWNNVFLEGRFTYRATFNEDLLARADGTAAGMGNWGVGALLGYEF
ncbi:MAG TPA: outer membrane beta-barrel protein [Myxococcales bacterium]